MSALAEKIPQAEKIPLFISPEEQLNRAWNWNLHYSWKFEKADFPPVPKITFVGEMSTLVLEISLGNEVLTILAARDAIKQGYSGFDFEVDFNLKPESFRLYGQPCARGVRWRAIDLSANWQPQPLSANAVRKNMPDVELPSRVLLWAAAYFPGWLRMMDGLSIPWVSLPGYSCTPGSIQSWTRVPYIGPAFSGGPIRLTTANHDYAYERRAVPVFLGDI